MIKIISMILLAILVLASCYNDLPETTEDLESTEQTTTIPDTPFNPDLTGPIVEKE